MIVLDASVMVDVLLALSPHASAVAQGMAAHANVLAAPELLDVEVTQVLRRHVLSRAISARRAEAALDDLTDLAIHRYPHRPLMARVFAWHRNVTAYDGVYLALAEGLGGELWTRDRGLAQVAGCRAKVRVFS